ncbi:hypothetical protein HJG53_14090 [Sphingomonas sp. ID1715]|uniref:hypothetical protein n=1 Tax=Sphingomonas sp. ID1715 TaxID=1656898 RepID=UPI0018243835|nr:hypothetical protein [Sphingomonas sp. ID1715]NNM78033.1 hypothetical protein [Sphingomonas sp. ID1715]
MPRFLQRGFVADPADEGERAWLHRRGAEPKLVGIRHIGVEDWFYSSKSVDGSPTLDDAITNYERDLAPSVRALREAAPGVVIDPHETAQTVVHLVLRAAHLRNLLSSGVSRLKDEIAAMFTNPARLGAMIGLGGPALGEAMIRAIRDTAAQLVPTGIPAAFAERLMTFMLRELGDQLVANAANDLAPLMVGAFGDVAVRIREAHASALARPLADNGWVGELSQFVWRVEAGEDLILPDAVALSRAPGESLAPMFFTSGADTELIVVPVAPTRILVGRRNDATFDTTRFNHDAAAASDSFFVAATPMGGTGLVEQIGTGPARALEQTIEETIQEAEQARKLTTCALEPVQPEERISGNFSYSVRLADFGDTILAKEIADIVQAVVARLSREIPLQDLDGLTIAADYNEALALLDRGNPELPPVTSGALGYGLGVAKPVTVCRDGRRKEHLVIAAGIAEAWIAQNAETRSFGLHTLVKMLAGIAHTTRYAGALTKTFMPDPMTREFHFAVATVPSGYWAARHAAFIAPDQGETYAALVLESLDFAEREITASRGKMADGSDIGPTTQRALECVAAVLGHAADWLGHRDGLTEGDSFAGANLPERLRPRGLDRWLEVFGRDLTACYGPSGILEFSIVTTLSRHVERLFWSFGLYCWPEGNDVRCIVSDHFFLPPNQAATDLS